MTTTPLKINWHGYPTAFGGYGNANLQWSTALEKVTDGGVTIGFGKMKKEDDPEVYNALTEDQKKLWVDKPYHKERLGVIKSIPNLFYRNDNKVRVGFTMIENTKIGEEWVKECNKMDYILVPNKDNKQSFIDCGVNRPIFVVRQGFNPDQFKYIERKPNKDKFTFSLSGFLDDRKNWQDVVRAFCSEFNHNEPVELLLKNSNPAFGYWVPNDKRIHIIDKMFSPEDMRKFYEITDCFMFTTRGEGSGLPAREAMACFPGKTNIYSDTKIEKFYKRKYSGVLYKITTKNSSVEATPNHPFLTDSGWKKAKDLTKDDCLYILSYDEKKLLEKGRIRDIGKNLSDNKNEGAFKLFTRENLFCDTPKGRAIEVKKKILNFCSTAKTLYVRNRHFLFSWINGWGGNFYFQTKQKKKQNNTNHSIFKYRHEINKFFTGKNRKKKLFLTIKKRVTRKKNTIYLRIKRFFNFEYINCFRTISLSKKRTLWNFDFFYKKKDEDISRLSKLYRERLELLEKNKGIEPQRIKKIEKKQHHGFVYNLKTEDGKYFANGILVHNCGAPTILTNYQGLAEVADSRYNYPIDPISIDFPDGRPEQPGFMARLDISEIMYWMRYIYEHQIEAFAKGKLAAEWMRKDWTWKKCAKEMADILEKL